MQLEEIKDKITKILALAQRGGTEAEADTAMSKVLEMLAKHNLSMSDIEETETKDEDVTHESEDLSGVRQTWEVIIYKAIATLYFCEAYRMPVYKLNGKSKRSMLFIGKPTNITTVKEISRYLIELGNELSKSSGQDAGFRNSWKTGYADRIRSRCYSEKADATKKIEGQNNERSLAIINLYAVTKTENTAYMSDYMRKNNMHWGRPSALGGSYRSEEGYKSGANAGAKVSLNSIATKRLE